jgi:hypothetical protein
VADELAGRDQRRGGGDLTVGDAEKDEIGLAAVGTPAEWPLHVESRDTHRSVERVTQPAGADDRAAEGLGGGVEGGPFQFPHGRYRSVLLDHCAATLPGYALSLESDGPFNYRIAVPARR